MLNTLSLKAVETAQNVDQMTSFRGDIILANVETVVQNGNITKIANAINAMV